MKKQHDLVPATGEFAYIDWLRRQTPTDARLLIGPGDDCAALRLKRIGVIRVRPLGGGYQRWRDLGLPIVVPEAEA